MPKSAKPDPLQRLRRFLGELKRRKVYRVAVVYLIGAVAGLELMDALVPASRLPDWSDELFLGLAVFGFPLVVILAWAFEITPEGVRLTESTGDAPASGSAYPVAALVLLVGMAAAVWWTSTREQAVEVVPRIAAPSPQSTEPAGQTAGAQHGSPVRDRPFVAVLPLENLSPDEENAYFTAGIHEEILSQLSKISGLGVFARTTMNQYRGVSRSIVEIGRELGAAAVLEGSVRRAGDRVRITAQLIDPATQDHLWSETYDRRLDDVFAVQEDIARRVVENLAATLSPSEEVRMSMRPTENLAAYDLYLRGRDAYRRFTGEANQEAARLFEKALELDPEYALAWAGLGDTYAQRDGRFGYAQGGSAEVAVRHARRAIAIDPELAEGHKALGDAYYKLGRREQARAAFLAAVEYDPNNYEAWVGVAVVNYNLGRFEESVRTSRRAARLAPNEISPRSMVAHAYKFLRMDEEAKEWMESMLVLDPDHPSPRLLQAQYALYEGDTNKALSLSEQLIRDVPDDAWVWTGAAGMAYASRAYARTIEWARESLRLAPGNTWAYWHTTEVLLGNALLLSGAADPARGYPGQVTAGLEERMAAGQNIWSLPWDLASAYGALGEGDRALDTLEHAYNEGFRFVRWPPIEPAFDIVREHPRYLSLMARIDADVEAMRARLVEEEAVTRH